MASQNKNIARYRRIVTKINNLEDEYSELLDKDFPAKTALLKMRFRSGELLDSLLPEAFALVREAAIRTVHLRAFNVQLQGAIAVHEGKIAEMKTGEGKTLTIVFAAFLNALEGKGVHIVTTNDYLAKRDTEWMGKVFSFLDMSVGVVASDTDDFERQLSYTADVTYVSNNEVGFDYLKDNMLYDRRNRRQRGLFFAIVDEADSVLIDEAQNPLVLSDQTKTSQGDKKNFIKINKYIKKLKQGVDFKINKKELTISLTIPGVKKLESLLGVMNLYDSQTDYLYYVDRLLKAHFLFQKDRDYVVEDGKVVIVDEFTGRAMPSHRFFQGIHQAIETKEELVVLEETRTMAQITFQHLFKRYKKMAGLTGTAESSSKEFRMIYGKEVVQIPTNKKVVRDDMRDRFFLNWENKVDYLTWLTQELHSKQDPVLIGTKSIKKSQDVYQSLMAHGIPNNVLNAKHAAREAELVAQAGQPARVTVATNMAGRGTDIELEDSVKKQGGLSVLGTERHNSRRIDNQLIGRAGRQGDPGTSQFLVSADDDLIRTHFKKEYITQLKKHKGWADGVQSGKMQTIVKRAQRRMEDLFFDQRVLVYEFDRVLEVQRDSFYRQRNRVLLDNDLKDETVDLLKRYVYRYVIFPQRTNSEKLSAKQVGQIKKSLKRAVINRWFDLKFAEEACTVSEMRKKVYDSIVKYYDDFEKYISEEKMRKVEKTVTLKVLDLLWFEHLQNVEEIQNAALVSSIGKNDFFQVYEVEMSKAYQAMLHLAPRVISQTFLRTMNSFLSVSEDKTNKHSYIGQ